ncbi:MAG TPA: TetR/AcrR family transcriptional regulator C-terminal ligand-binding domain-containing protein [Acetobacteraceae bacterium]|nr:TetR/AcrR family transcriptional regulator C-terminal ligand-binding domain-containing protein [Acetobacteraceae bacterium]
MDMRSAKPARKPRADALRNRERVLEAAKAVFSAAGPDRSLEAVYRREVDQLAEFAEQLKSEPAPVEALRRWMRSNVEFVATKKGMSAALALAVSSSSDLTAYSVDRLTRAVGGLLQRAVDAGEIRGDISPEDLLRTLVGLCYTHDRPGWQDNVLRLVDVFVNGLRRPESG